MPLTSGTGGQIPAYQRLSDDLRSKLMSGEFAPEERLPTETDLASEYGMSRQTVRRAFQDLVAEGLVYRIPGRGTFPGRFIGRGRYVRSIGAVEDLQAFAETEMEVIRGVELIPDGEAAAKLELDSKVVASIVLRRLYEGVPFGYTRIYLPPGLGQRLVESENLNDKGIGTVIGALERLVPSGIAGVDQEITVSLISEEAAAQIDCDSGQHCLKTERTYFDSDGIPVEVAISFYNPDRYTYRLQLQRRTR